MRWHKSTITHNPEYNSHFIIKTLDNNVHFVKWNRYDKIFYDTKLINVKYPLHEINEWCYVEEDDCVTDEILALNAIYSAVTHVQSLYDILLTDGILCSEEYRKQIGLDELQIVKDKLSKRILYLDALM